jgi:5-methylthioadenosine/S-adenosylhomocysteine deaminase
MSILLRGGTVIPLTGPLYDPGDVLIGPDGRIADVGPSPDVPAQAETVIDCAGKAVLPGLVNAHTHLSQTFIRGLGDDKTLIEWLRGVTWPFQAAITPDELYLATLLGLVENLTCGVTALTEHHKVTNTPAHSDAVLRAIREVGLPVTLAYGWNDLGRDAPAVDQIIAEMERLRAAAAGTNAVIAVGPMAPWRCSDEAMQRTFALAEAWDVPFHIHAAETEGEVAQMIERCGMRHIEWLAWLGCLTPRTQLVHAVWLSDDEVRLVQKSGARVIHCPTSNMYLASGTAKIPAMYMQGIPIALGADGSGSNNSQDMLELLKITILLAKIDTMNPTTLVPADVVKMAVVEGAAAAGVGGGRLIVGEPARLIAVDLDTPRSAPVHSPLSALVYNAVGPDVDTVIVGSRILMRGKVVQGIDVPALIAECKAVVRSLARRIGW